MNRLFLFFLLPFIFQTKGLSLDNKIDGKNITLPSYLMSSFLDLSDDIANLKEENKRLILFIHQQNCPYCEKFIEHVLKKEDIKAKVLKDFGLLELDMFGNREVIDFDGNELSEKLFIKNMGIQFTPTVVFFNEDAKPILKLHGLVDPEKFRIALEYAANKKEFFMDFQEYLNNKNIVSNEQPLINEDFFIKNSQMLSRMKDKKELAVIFESKNCIECVTLHKTHLQDKMIRQSIKSLDVAQLDFNVNKNIATPHNIIMEQKKWFKQLNISSLPTIIFFDPEGKEIIRMSGLHKIFHTQSVFDYVASGAYKNEKEFQRYLTKRVNKIKSKGEKVDIWK